MSAAAGGGLAAEFSQPHRLVRGREYSKGTIVRQGIRALLTTHRFRRNTAQYPFEFHQLGGSNLHFHRIYFRNALNFGLFAEGTNTVLMATLECIRSDKIMMTDIVPNDYQINDSFAVDFWKGPCSMLYKHMLW